jgi:hypothetical protein
MCRFNSYLRQELLLPRQTLLSKRWYPLIGVKVKVVPVHNQSSTTPWRRKGQWMYRSTFSWPRTSWKWVVRLTPQPLYPRGKSPRYPLDRRLGGPQSRSRRRGENCWPYRDSNSDPSVVQPVTSRYTDYTIPVPHLQEYTGSNPRRSYYEGSPLSEAQIL